MIREATEPRGKPSLEDAYKAIRKAAEKAFRKYSPLQRQMEEEDVANGYFLHYMERGYHQKFDPAKRVPLSAWVGMGIRNWCIDHLRDGNFQFSQEGETVFRTISGDDTDLGESYGDSLLSRTADSREPYEEVEIEDLLETLDNSPTEDLICAVSPLKGFCWFSQQTLAEHLLAGYTVADVYRIFDLSKYRASKVLQSIRRDLEMALTEVY